MVFVATAAVLVLAVLGAAGAGHLRSTRSRWVHELDAVRGEALLRPASSELPGAPPEDRHPTVATPASPADRHRLTAGHPDATPDVTGVVDLTCGVTAVRAGGGVRVLGRDRRGVPAAELVGSVGWAWVRPARTLRLTAGDRRRRGAGPSARRSAVTAVVVGAVELQAPATATALIVVAPEALVVTAVEGSVSVRTAAARLTLGRGGVARVDAGGSARVTVASSAALAADPLVAVNHRHDRMAAPGRPAAVPARPARPPGPPGRSRHLVTAERRAQ